MNDDETIAHIERYWRRESNYKKLRNLEKSGTDVSVNTPKEIKSKFKSRSKFSLKNDPCVTEPGFLENLKRKRTQNIDEYENVEISKKKKEIKSAPSVIYLVCEDTTIPDYLKPYVKSDTPIIKNKTENKIIENKNFEKFKPENQITSTKELMEKLNEKPENIESKNIEKENTKTKLLDKIQNEDVQKAFDMLKSKSKTCENKADKNTENKNIENTSDNDLLPDMIDVPIIKDDYLDDIEPYNQEPLKIENENVEKQKNENTFKPDKSTTHKTTSFSPNPIISDSIKTANLFTSFNQPPNSTSEFKFTHKLNESDTKNNFNISATQNKSPPKFDTIFNSNPPIKTDPENKIFNTIATQPTNNEFKFFNFCTAHVSSSSNLPTGALFTIPITTSSLSNQSNLFSTSFNTANNLNTLKQNFQISRSLESKLPISFPQPTIPVSTQVTSSTLNIFSSQSPFNVPTQSSSTPIFAQTNTSNTQNNQITVFKSFFSQTPEISTVQPQTPIFTTHALSNPITTQPNISISSNIFTPSTQPSVTSISNFSGITTPNIFAANSFLSQPPATLTFNPTTTQSNIFGSLNPIKSESQTTISLESKPETLTSNLFSSKPSTNSMSFNNPQTPFNNFGTSNLFPSVPTNTFGAFNPQATQSNTFGVPNLHPTQPTTTSDTISIEETQSNTFVPPNLFLSQPSTNFGTLSNIQTSNIFNTQNSLFTQPTSLFNNLPTTLSSVFGSTSFQPSTSISFTNLQTSNTFYPNTFSSQPSVSLPFNNFMTTSNAFSVPSFNSSLPSTSISFGNLNTTQTNTFGTSSLFSSQPSTTGVLYGNLPTTSNIFGGSNLFASRPTTTSMPFTNLDTASNTFSASNLFSSQPSTISFGIVSTQPSIFCSSNLFSQPTISSAFNNLQSTQSNVFSGSIFFKSQPFSTSISENTSTKPNIFGSNTFSSQPLNSFGNFSTGQSTNNFGQANSFSTQPINSNLFGNFQANQPFSSSNALFSQPAISNSFGSFQPQSSAFSTYGAPITTQANIFGASNVFSSQPASSGTFASNSFNSNTTPNFGSSNLFGAQSKPVNNFTNQPSLPFNQTQPSSFNKFNENPAQSSFGGFSGFNKSTFESTPKSSSMTRPLEIAMTTYNQPLNLNAGFTLSPLKPPSNLNTTPNCFNNSGFGQPNNFNNSNVFDNSFNQPTSQPQFGSNLLPNFNNNQNNFNNPASSGPGYGIFGNQSATSNQPTFGNTGFGASNSNLFANPQPNSFGTPNSGPFGNNQPNFGQFQSPNTVPNLNFGSIATANTSNPFTFEPPQQSNSPSKNVFNFSNSNQTSHPKKYLRAKRFMKR